MPERILKTYCMWYPHTRLFLRTKIPFFENPLKSTCRLRGIAFQMPLIEKMLGQ